MNCPLILSSSFLLPPSPDCVTFWDTSASSSLYLEPKRQNPYIERGAVVGVSQDSGVPFAGILALAQARGRKRS